MPTPLERDWKRVQDGDVPPWWTPTLDLCGQTMSSWIWRDIHFATRVRWLWGQGWWVEPPSKYEECYVAAHADLGYALSATDPDEALQEACELCEAATSSQPEGS